MFYGTYHHAIDAKGRTSLPSKWREVLAGKNEERLFITQGPQRSLWCYPPAAWTELEQQVQSKPQFDASIRAFVHAFIAPAQDCTFDKMGRILVPPNLREYAELEGDVVWLGLGKRAELVSLARWKKINETSIAGLDDGSVFQSVGGFGF